MDQTSISPKRSKDFTRRKDLIYLRIVLHAERKVDQAEAMFQGRVAHATFIEIIIAVGVSEQGNI